MSNRKPRKRDIKRQEEYKERRTSRILTAPAVDDRHFDSPQETEMSIISALFNSEKPRVKPPPMKAPAEETKAPVQDTKAPAEETKDPTQEVKAPSQETKAPAQESKAPTEESKTPVLADISPKSAQSKNGTPKLSELKKEEQSLQSDPVKSPDTTDIEISFYDEANITPAAKSLSKSPLDEEVSELEIDLFQTHKEVEAKVDPGIPQKSIAQESAAQTQKKVEAKVDPEVPHKSMVQEPAAAPTYAHRLNEPDSKPEKEEPKPKKAEAHQATSQLERAGVAKLGLKRVDSDEKAPEKPSGIVPKSPAPISSESVPEKPSGIVPKSPAPISSESVMAAAPQPVKRPHQYPPAPMAQNQQPHLGPQPYSPAYPQHRHPAMWHGPGIGMNMGYPPQSNGWNQPNSQADPQYFPYHPPMGDGQFPGFYPYPPMHQPEFFVPYPPPHGYGNGYVDPSVFEHNQGYQNMPQRGRGYGSYMRGNQRGGFDSSGWKSNN